MAGRGWIENTQPLLDGWRTKNLISAAPAAANLRLEIVAARRRLVAGTRPWHRRAMDWLMAHFGRLAKLLRDRGRTREEAEDLIQEAFLRVKVYCDEGGEVRQPEAFLVRTVLNLSRDLHEHEHRHLYVQKPVEELLIADTAPAPDEVLALEQRMEQLNQALQAVSERTREVFYLHRLHDLSYAQIADHFDISVSAVEKHVAKAMSVIGREMLRS